MAGAPLQRVARSRFNTCAAPRMQRRGGAGAGREGRVSARPCRAGRATRAPRRIARASTARTRASSPLVGGGALTLLNCQGRLRDRAPRCCCGCRARSATRCAMGACPSRDLKFFVICHKCTRRNMREHFRIRGHRSYSAGTLACPGKCEAVWATVRKRWPTDPTRASLGGSASPTRSQSATSVPPRSVGRRDGARF